MATLGYLMRPRSCSCRSTAVFSCLSVRATNSNLVFGDMGSGCGRLVVAQALAWPWRSCRGVEKVQSLHNMAEAALIRAGHMSEDPNTLSTEARRLLRNMALCSLSLGDVNNEV